MFYVILINKDGIMKIVERKFDDYFSANEYGEFCKIMSETVKGFIVVDEEESVMQILDEVIDDLS